MDFAYYPTTLLKASKSSYRKRRALKTPRVKARRRLDFTCGSVKSDGVKTMTSSREELIEDEEDENEEVEYGSDEPERESTVLA